MKSEFMIERNGKNYCLYAGLLDEAHRQGLREIRTNLVQIPDESNGNVAIVTATAVVGEEPHQKTFTGIGDASPNNVARAMVTCTIRLAETRAKARALRDAVNVGAAAFEELDDTAGDPGAPTAPASSPPRSAAGRPAPHVTGADDCTPAQKRMLQALAEKTGAKLPPLATLTREDAARLINELKAG